MSKKRIHDDAPVLEEALSELELIVRRLEQGGGTLDKDLADYARAIQLIKLSHGRLAEAEKSVQLLSGVDAEGNPVAEPFAAAPDTLEQKQSERSRRRSAPSGEELF